MSDAYHLRYNLLILAREIASERGSNDVEEIIEIAKKLNKFVSTKISN